MPLKKRIIFLVVVPFLLILVSIYSLYQFNKEQMIAGFKEITLAEGDTIGRLVENSGSHLAENGEERLTAFLDRLYENESIIYIGLFREGELVYLLSRFEGFFPVGNDQEKYRIMDTPVGKIFEISGRFGNNAEGAGPVEDLDAGNEVNDDLMYRLHIGFDYGFLSSFETAASRNFSVVAGIFSLLMLTLIGLVIFFDKTFYRKQIELEAERQEKERFKELSLLTSEIAHEIKNPLNSIYLSFNTLEKYCSDEETPAFYRGAIKAEIKRITAILDGYSGLSKEIQPDIRPVEIDVFLNEFELLAVEELNEKNVEFKCGFSGTDRVNTDKNLLKQILLNLVKNAVEAGATEVYLDMSLEPDSLTARVTDNGGGIGEDLKESIFKPYTSTKTKGMGLGLHICQRLAGALNGEVSLESSQRGKTVFTVKTAAN